MSLTILYSDRVADLAADLRKRLLARRAAGADPFDFVPVAVPNRNLEKWLRVRAFADEPALAAGVEFPFLDSFAAGFLRDSLPDGPRPRALAPDRLRNAIAHLLVAGGDPDLAPLRRYVDPGAEPGRPLVPATDEAARKLWQLAARLAQLAGEYDLRRPAMVEGWLGGAEASAAPAGEIERAERALARALFGPGGPFPGGPGAKELTLRQLFARVRGAPPKGPARDLFLFGHSSLSPLHAQILHWLARTHRVVLHHLTVCLEYWGDVEAPWERARRAGAADPGDIACENELLAAWGRAGRETMRLLVDLEEENREVDLRVDAIPPAPDDRPPTVLSAVQSSVRRRTSELPRRAQDASVQAVSSQSVRREVETVYNAILGAVWKPAGAGRRPWPDCTFSDIAVLVPDMAAYRPAIEEVFDGRGQIPYGLVDATAEQDSALLRGLLALLRLAASGLGRAALFDVLSNPCAQRALRFGPEELRRWRDRVDEIGAFRGFDAEDAASLGLADAGNTSWDYALSRLRLASVAEEADGPDGGALPLPGRPDGDDLRLGEIVEELHRALSPLRDAALPCVAPFAGDGAPPASWAEAATRLLDRFLAAAPDDRLEAEVRRAIPAALFALGDFGFGAQRLPFAAQCIGQFVGALPSRRGGYLTSGVTIASLQPMRPVPFRQVFVLGLDEGRFPGTVSDSTLDLRGLGRAVGDARMPDINRYLFLETLMAARDRFVLSWVSKDLRKDEDLFPCSVVRDLERFVAAHALPEGATFRECATPLLESDPRSTRALDWDAESAEPWRAGLLPTYHARSREAALLRAGGAAPDAPDASVAAAAAAAASPDAAEAVEIRLHDLAEFLKDPLKAVLGRRFQIETKGYQGKALPDDPALSLSFGPDLWDAQRGLVGFWLSAPGKPDLAGFRDEARRRFERLRRGGAMPEGFLGDYEFGRTLGDDGRLAADLASLEAIADLRAAGPRAPEPLRVRVPLDVPMPDGSTVRATLSGEIADWFPPAAAGDPGTALAVRSFRNTGVVPPEAAIEPLLVWIAACAAEAGPPERIRVALLKFKTDEPGIQVSFRRWARFGPEKARGWLARLAADWLSFAKAADGDGRVVSFGWRALSEALALPDGILAAPPSEPGALFAAVDWDATLAALVDPPENPHGGGGGGFDRSLAVGTLSEEFVRDPATADEAREVAERRFAPLFDEVRG